MSDQIEIWKSVVGYEGLYEVSSHGRVRSLPRMTKTGFCDGRTLTPARLPPGYLRVALSNKSKMKSFLVHRLMLAAFDREPLPEEETRHLNGVKDDNRISNLKWGTKLDNARDRVLHGTQRIFRGESHGMAILRETDVRKIMERKLSGRGTTDLAKEFGVSPTTVYDIQNHRSWRHLLREPGNNKH